MTERRMIGKGQKRVREVKSEHDEGGVERAPINLDVDNSQVVSMVSAGIGHCCFTVIRLRRIVCYLRKYPVDCIY